MVENILMVDLVTSNRCVQKDVLLHSCSSRYVKMY